MVGLMKYHQSVPVEAFSVSLSIYIHFINFYVLAVFYLSIYTYIYTKFLSVYTHLSVVTGWSFVESPEDHDFHEKTLEKGRQHHKNPYQIMTNYGGIPPN